MPVWPGIWTAIERKIALCYEYLVKMMYMYKNCLKSTDIRHIIRTFIEYVSLLDTWMWIEKLQHVIWELIYICIYI